MSAPIIRKRSVVSLSRRFSINTPAAAVVPMLTRTAGMPLRASIDTELSPRWSRNAPTIVSPNFPREAAASAHSSRSASRSSRSATNRRLRSFPTERIASRTTAISGSASRFDSKGSKQSGSSPSRHAASIRVRCPSFPCSLTMPLRICCAASIF